MAIVSPLHHWRVYTVLFACRLAALEADAEAECVDQNERWLKHGSSCEKVKGLCEDVNFGALVRSSCPRTCGLCPNVTDAISSRVAPSADGTGGTLAEHPEEDDIMSVYSSSAKVSAGRRNSTNSSDANNTGVPHWPREGLLDIKSDSIGGIAKNSDSNKTGNRSDVRYTRNTSEGNSSHSAEGGQCGQEEAVKFRTIAFDAESSLAALNMTPTARPYHWLEPAWSPTPTATGTNTSQGVISHQMYAAAPSIEVSRPILQLAFDSNNTNESSGFVPFFRGDFSALFAAAEAKSMTLEKANRTNRSNGENYTAEVVLKPISSVELKIVAAHILSIQKEEAKSCPENYERVIGEVHGGDQWTGNWHPREENIKDCAAKCSRTPGCGSFEYSNTTKQCFRNTQTRPTTMDERGDFIFCRRLPCPAYKTEEACTGPNVPHGYYSAEVTLNPGSYCIWSNNVCSAPMACGDQDCFLPDGGLPGMDLPPSQTLWISAAGLHASMGPNALKTMVR